MPQLNPAPWFAIFFFSWVVFLTLIPQKVLATAFPNDPTAQSTEKPLADSWNWPWH